MPAPEGAPADEMAAYLESLIEGVRELPGAMIEFQRRMHRLGTSEGMAAADAGSVVSKAASHDYAKFLNVANAMKNYINTSIDESITSISGPQILHSGYVDLNLVASPQTVNTNVISQPWVVDANATPVLSFFNQALAGTPPNYPSLNSYVNNYVAGTGFRINLESYGYLVVGTIRVFWWGFG